MVALPDGRELHLGVEEPFRPNRKAHPAFVRPALEDLAHSLAGRVNRSEILRRIIGRDNTEKSWRSMG